MTGIAELQAQALDATGRILRGASADCCWHAATPAPAGTRSATERPVPARALTPHA